MILHYLGLDHIGHISGPKSHLVPLKLKEMDDVIRKIHEAMKNKNAAIVVCGDHGNISTSISFLIIELLTTINFKV